MRIWLQSEVTLSEIMSQQTWHERFTKMFKLLFLKERWDATSSLWYPLEIGDYHPDHAVCQGQCRWPIISSLSRAVQAVNICGWSCIVICHRSLDSQILPSCWFTTHSAFSNFIHKSVMSQNMANPSMFPLPNRIQYLPVCLLYWELPHK